MVTRAGRPLLLPFTVALFAGAVACGGATAVSGPAASAKASAAQAGASAPGAEDKGAAAPKAEAIGPAAPPLTVRGWVGARPAPSERPRLVAAWATWCPGCRSETALLSALAKKYAGKVDVIALSDETAEDVKGFEAKLTAPVTLGFPVALSERSSEDKPLTIEAYFRAVGMQGAVLPHAFLVVSHKIVWHGDGDDAGAALDELLATGDAAQARTAKDELESLKKRYLDDFAAGGSEKAKASGEALLKAAHGHAGFLNALAWDIVYAEKGTDLAFGLELAKAGVEASGESEYPILDTLGLALYKSGKKDEALAVQKKCVALCDALGGYCPEERGRLRKFSAP